VNADGTLKIETPGKNEDTPVDNFYREQSLWEVQPVSARFAGITVPIANRIACQIGMQNNDELAIKAAGEGLSPEYVYLHLIPASAGGEYTVSAWFKKHEKLVHDPNNVLRLAVTKLNDGRLTNFRTDWVNFFLQQKGNIEDQAVVEQARVMKKKYADLFS
jgi:hypothetical protein